MGSGLGGASDIMEGVVDGVKNVAKKAELRKDGSLRNAAKEIHENLGDTVARQKRTIAIGEVEMPNGSIEYWASASGNNWSKVARQLAEEKGFKVAKWSPIEGQPVKYGILGDVKTGNLTHAEMIILNSLPEGAKVKRFGIAWTIDKKTGIPKTIPCETKCDPIVNELGIKID
jgi:hypothetical protein